MPNFSPITPYQPSDLRGLEQNVTTPIDRGRGRKIALGQETKQFVTSPDSLPWQFQHSNQPINVRNATKEQFAATVSSSDNEQGSDKDRSSDTGQAARPYSLFPSTPIANIDNISVNSAVDIFIRDISYNVINKDSLKYIFNLFVSHFSKIESEFINLTDSIQRKIITTINIVTDELFNNLLYDSNAYLNNIYLLEILEAIAKPQHINSINNDGDIATEYKNAFKNLISATLKKINYNELEPSSWAGFLKSLDNIILKSSDLLDDVDNGFYQATKLPKGNDINNIISNLLNNLPRFIDKMNINQIKNIIYPVSNLVNPLKIPQDINRQSEILYDCLTKIIEKSENDVIQNKTISQLIISISLLIDKQCLPHKYSPRNNHIIRNCIYSLLNKLNDNPTIEEIVTIFTGMLNIIYIIRGGRTHHSIPTTIRGVRKHHSIPTTIREKFSVLFEYAFFYGSQGFVSYNDKHYIMLAIIKFIKEQAIEVRPSREQVRKFYFQHVNEIASDANNDIFVHLSIITYFHAYLEQQEFIFLMKNMCFHNLAGVNQSQKLELLNFYTSMLVRTQKELEADKDNTDLINIKYMFVSLIDQTVAKFYAMNIQKIDMDIQKYIYIAVAISGLEYKYPNTSKRDLTNDISNNASKRYANLIEYLTGEKVITEHNLCNFLAVDMYIPKHNLVVEYKGRRQFIDNECKYESSVSMVTNELITMSGYDFLQITHNDFSDDDTIFQRNIIAKLKEKNIPLKHH